MMSIPQFDLEQFETFLQEKQITSIALFVDKSNLSRVYAAHLTLERSHGVCFNDDVTKHQVIDLLQRKGIFFDYGIDTD
jgi:hypothetical protein